MANVVIISGTVAASGPTLRYRADGRAVCSFILEVENRTKAGKQFQQLVAIEIWGSQAEETAASLEAGMPVLVNGTLGFRSQDKVKQPAIICWGVEVLARDSATA